MRYRWWVLRHIAGLMGLRVIAYASDAETQRPHLVILGAHDGIVREALDSLMDAYVACVMQESEQVDGGAHEVVH